MSGRSDGGGNDGGGSDDGQSDGRSDDGQSDDGQSDDGQSDDGGSDGGGSDGGGSDGSCVAFATRVRMAEWRAAKRWRDRVALTLKGAGISFAQWQVLAAVRELIVDEDPFRDAVNHSQVAARLHLDRSTVLHLMRVLEHKRLVSHGPSSTGVEWRVLLTDEGAALLEANQVAIEQASRLL